MMKAKRCIVALLSALMFVMSTGTGTMAADVRSYYDSEVDTSLRDITNSDKIEWEKGAFVSNSDVLESQDADDCIKTVINLTKRSLFLKASEGYEFMVYQTVEADGVYTVKRRYSPTFVPPFGTWIQSGYFNVYPDRYYTVTVRSADGNILNVSDAKKTLKIYEVDNANHIPEYYVDHIREKSEIVNNLQDNENSFSFVFITDTHVQQNAKHSFPMIKYLLNRCAINQVLGGGDWVTAWLSDAEGIYGLWDDYDELRYLFKDIPLIKTIGNHEWGYGGLNQWNISDAQAHNRFYREDAAGDNNIVYGDKYKTYFYKDDKVNKMRYISLNCMDYPSIKDVAYEGNKTMWFDFSQEQIDWVKNVALDLPDDEWTCLAFSHVPVYTADESPWGDASQFSNILPMRKVFSDYVKKTGDMANCKGDFIGWLSGHVHADSMVRISNFIQVTTDGDTAMKADVHGNTRELNAVTEQCFDVFTVNKETRTVNITRIGAGEDRSFKY